MIIFTRRELERAWKQAWNAYYLCENKTNAHRLLLFYAVETGLKAVLLKRENKQDSDGEFSEFQHDLNKIMDYLGIGKNLHFNRIKLNILQGKQRNASNGDIAKSGELNQIWRYGAQAQNPTDEELEKKLLAIQEWIKQELTK